MREAPLSEHHEADQPRNAGDHALLIQEEGGDRVLILGDRVRRLPREELERNEATPSWEPQEEDEVAREVTSWKAERDLQRRRVSMAKVLLILTERMQRCRKRGEVLDVLSEMAHQVVEASWTVVYAREGGAGDAGGTDGAEADRLHPRLHPDLRLDGPALSTVPAEALTAHCGPVVFTAEMLDTGEEPELAGLRDIFHRLGAASLVAVPLGDEGLLVVLERRRRRSFDDEDCFFLRSIARSAEERLARVYSPLRDRARHSSSIPSNASSMNSTAGPQSRVDRGSNP